MKAGVDLDGVVADLLTPFLKEANRKFGLSLKPEDVISHEFSDWIPGVDWDEVRGIWDNSQFILGQQPVPWAKWGVRHLKDLGYAIYIVTARKSHLKAATLEWLKKQEIPFDEVVTGKREEKWSYIERERLDIFIEDKAQNALEAARFCERVYLIDMPYNKQLNRSKIIRVKEWREIIKYERGYVAQEGN